MAGFPRPFGPFILRERIGGGGMGEVFLASPSEARRDLPPSIVIKTLHNELARGGDFTRRFRHEAGIARRIVHPNVAKVYEDGEVGGVLYLAMEHLSGWPLSRVMDALGASGRGASITLVVETIDSVLAGLGALHGAKDPDENAPLAIIHRDVTPKNVMIGKDGRARLIDLGLGKSNLQDWKTRTGRVMGTAGYMSPEQALGRPVDARSDLYSAGVVLFELLTLEPYVPPGPLAARLMSTAKPAFRLPSSIREDVPPDLDAVLAKALAIDPGDRFQTAEEFRNALRDAAALEAPADDTATLLATMFRDSTAPSSEVRPLASTPPPPPPPAARGRWVPVMAGALGVSIVLGGVAAWSRRPATPVAKPLAPAPPPPPAFPGAVGADPEPEPELAADGPEPPRRRSPAPPPRSTPPAPAPRPAPRAPSASPPPAPTPPPAAARPQAALQERARALYERAIAARNEAPPQSRAALQEIADKVLYEVASADTERAARRIADLEVELEGLINRR